MNLWYACVCGGIDGHRPHLECMGAQHIGLWWGETAPKCIEGMDPSGDGVQQGCNWGSNDGCRHHLLEYVKMDERQGLCNIH